MATRAQPPAVPAGGRPMAITAAVKPTTPTRSMPNSATSGPSLRPVNRAMKSAPPQESALAMPQNAAFTSASAADGGAALAGLRPVEDAQPVLAADLAHVL